MARSCEMVAVEVADFTGRTSIHLEYRHLQPPRTCVHARDQHSPREDETRGALATPRVGWEPWQGGVESAGNAHRLSPCLQGPCPVQAMCTTQMTWPGSSYGIFMGVPHGVCTKSGLAQAVAQQLVYPRGLSRSNLSPEVKCPGGKLLRSQPSPGHFTSK